MRRYFCILEAQAMMALEIVSEEDPQGTIVRDWWALDLDQEQLRTSSDTLFKAVLADRDRLIDMITERDLKIRELERALALKIEILEGRE